MIKKKWLLSLAAGMGALLLICVFLSRTISEAFLPQVFVEAVRQGTLQNTERVAASVILGEERAVYSPCDLEVDAVLLAKGSRIQAGDEILSAKLQPFFIQKKQLEAVVMQLELEGETWKSRTQQAEWEKRLSIAKDQLEQFAADFPEDGVIYGETDGQLVSLGIHPNASVHKGDLLYSYYTTEAVVPHVSFDLKDDMHGLEVGDRVEVEYEQSNTVNNEEIITLNTATCSISEKNWNEDGGWSFKAVLEDVSGLKDHQRVTVRVSTEEQMYSQIVPLTAVSRMDQTATVFILRTREGIFGDETYLQQIDVSEIFSNDRYAALAAEELTGESVVVSTDKSLSDDMRVKVIE